MTLETINIDELKKSIETATAIELPQVEWIREKVRDLQVAELNQRQCHAISPVATDGGENRLDFDPMNLEVVRVVDSEGNEHVIEVIPLSGEPKFFPEMFKKIRVLSDLLKRLNTKYEDISKLLPYTKGWKEREESGELESKDYDNRRYVRAFREILEWAVCLDIAWNPGYSKVLVIRDGLLRSKAFSKDSVQKLSDSFKQAYEKKGSLIAGVAKQSKVLNYLSLSIALEKTFQKNYPCFSEVPEELEKNAYKYADSWMGGFAFAKMHLAKLCELPRAMVFPVDIPHWLMHKRKEILEYLVYTASRSFPVIGYPYPLVKAHENAVLHGLEMSVLSDFMLNTIKNKFPDESDKILEYIKFGRGIVKGGIKE